MNNQLSLFSYLDQPQERDLHAVRCKFVESYDTNKNELFSGFDDIKILTFSYGMGFVNEILSKFKTAEIILGSEIHAKYDMLEVMANQEDPASPFFGFQGATLRRIRRCKYLVDRIHNGEVSIWLAKDIISHEKMYILTRTDGSKSRVIAGSANFSGTAFNGDSQREGIYVFDNDATALNEALEEFEMVRDFCTQEVIKNSVYFSNDGKPDNEEKEMEQLPVIAEAIAKKSGIILNSSDLDSEDIQYAMDVSNLTRKFASVIPKRNSKDGKIEIKALKVNELIRDFKKTVREDTEKRQQYPQFRVDIANVSASLNGKEFTLEPDAEHIREDVGLLLKFYEGYNEFIGNADISKASSFMLLNYMFITPFIGTVRNIAFMHKYSMAYFPLFAVLTGSKSAGKSSFVKAVQKFMFVKTIPHYSSDEWVKTIVKGLMHEISEVPILMDDISRDRFKSNADAIIKEDEYINKEGLATTPTFIITSNDIELSIDPALKKRMIYLTSNLTLDDVTAAHKAKSVSDSLEKITGAFYREFLRRAIPKVSEMIQLIENDTPEDDNWYPDLFKLSSEVIVEIVREYAELPSYITKLSFNDYFGNNTVMRREIREKILKDFEHNKSAFEIIRKKNELVYTPGERTYEAKRVKEALPEFLEAKIISNKILMKLDKAEEFFGIRFKKGFFH